MENRPAPHEPKPSADERSIGDWLSLWHEQNDDYALVFLDADAIVVGANPAVTRIVGHEPSELKGRSLSHIYSQDDLAKGIDVHELEVTRQLGRAENDRWHVGKDGRRVWISGVLTALKDADGRCLGFAKVLRDRTDVRTEIASLENRLSEANASAQRKVELLAALGHELRNPLHTLASAYQMLARQNDASATERILALVQRQLAVFTRILDDLRDATWVDIDSLRLELVPLDLRDAIRSACALHQPVAQGRSQTLRSILPEAPIMVRGDSIRIEQILRNLLDNATKYTPDGGKISVTATIEDTMGVLRVEDDGIGLSPEVLPRIFDLFTREGRAIESAADGLGIGLALVKSLVALHGGIIQVQSAGPGKGSEFTVRLPLTEPQPQPPP